MMMFANNSTTTTLNNNEFRGHNAQNSTCLPPIDSVAIMISYATINIVILIASLVGNTLLIFASLKSNMTMNLILANIAISDLLFSLVEFPREIVVHIKESTVFLVHGWIGRILCKICAFVADVTIAVSTLSLVLITIDRLVAVVFPRRYRRATVKERRILIFSTWILAMAIHSPYFYTFSLETRNGETLCITNWEPAFNHKLTHTRYYTALLVTVLIVPLVTVCILQTIILVKLKNDEMAPFRTSIANQRHKKRNKKLLKMSALIVLAFASCWLPFLAVQFLYLYFPNSIPRCSLGFKIFNQFAILFSLCHCIVNPSICFTFMRRIRKILCFKSKSKNTSPNPKIYVINTTTQKKSSNYMETRL
ncbi:neuropeptide Y receptor type 1-like [Oculina patagonica]